MLTLEAKKIFKRQFKTAIRKKSAVIDEAAFPAYAHRNPLIDRLFWGRLAATEKYLAALPLENVLDFGCGSGVMSYIMSGIAKQVVATDIEPASFNVMWSAIGFPDNIAFVPVGELLSGKYLRTFDVIIALDVLEHVADLTVVLQDFERLLRPGGVVVVSGPTENVFYKLGRRIAGKRFTGDYHVSDIGRIETECRRHGRVSTITTLYPMLPLFKIFSLRYSPPAEETA